MSIKIDKSVFTPEELETYKALIAKATVDPKAGEEEMEDERPEPPRRREFREEWSEEDVDTEKCGPKKASDTEKACDTKKSADPALEAAMEKLEKLEKSLAMKIVPLFIKNVVMKMYNQLHNINNIKSSIH